MPCVARQADCQRRNSCSTLEESANSQTSVSYTKYSFHAVFFSNPIVSYLPHLQSSLHQGPFRQCGAPWVANPSTIRQHGTQTQIFGGHGPLFRAASSPWACVLGHRSITTSLAPISHGDRAFTNEFSVSKLLHGKTCPTRKQFLWVSY